MTGDEFSDRIQCDINTPDGGPEEATNFPINSICVGQQCSG